MNIHSVRGQWIDMSEVAPEGLGYFDVWSLVKGRVTDAFWNGDQFAAGYSQYHESVYVPEVTHWMKVDPPRGLAHKEE